VAIALIFFGFGNILGGYLSGYLCDKLSVKAAGYLGSCFVIFGSVVEAIFLSIDKNV
jgi:predicted MFS family arabinose efflux permease